MADGVNLVLNDVLCFVRCKYGTVPAKQLKSCLVDFYDVDSISAAKVRLLNDVELVKMSVSGSVKIQHVPTRRDGESRLNREVDDILLLFCQLDENKILDNLPQYVASGPDNMPSSRIFEGDLRMLMKMLGDVNDKIAECNAGMLAISRDVSSLQVAVQRAPESMHLSLPCKTSVQPTCDNQWPALVSSQLVEDSGNYAGIETRTADQHAGDASDWATIASTPLIHDNRYAVLAAGSTDDESNTQGFQLASSRRSKRRRIQTGISVQQQQQQQHSSVAAPRTSTNIRDGSRRRGGPLVYGKATSHNSNISAAVVRPKKAVFYVGNLSVDCTTDALKSFVSGMSITVISCFNVRPRRRFADEADEELSNRKSFRLCILDKDRQRLLNESLWPESVTVCEWISKPQRSENVRRVENTRRRSDAAVSGAVEPPSSVVIERAADADAVAGSSTTPGTSAAATTTAVVTSSPSSMTLSTDMVVDVGEPSVTDDGDDRTILYHDAS